jgi:hypothetical protein
MFIPKILKVRTRGKEKNPLAYITYLDEKNVLRKEKSWSGWGDKQIDDVVNTPMSGFKLESSVSRSRDWFGTGRTLFRVIHPSNFVFELSANNFEEICKETGIIKGVFSGEYVLAWEGSNLALLPADTEDYKKHVSLTDKVFSGKVKTKDLVVGKNYNDKNGKCVGRYLGIMPMITNDYKYVFPVYSYNTKTGDAEEDKSHYLCKFSRKHVFADIKLKNGHLSYALAYSSPTVYESDNSDVVDVSNVEIRESSFKVIPSSFRGEYDLNELKTWYIEEVKDKEYDAKYKFEDKSFPPKI